jgi:hypothetical protein
VTAQITPAGDQSNTHLYRVNTLGNGIFSGHVTATSGPLIAAVPEPSTWTMMIFGVFGVSPQATWFGASSDLIDLQSLRAAERPPSGVFFVCGSRINPQRLRQA